jgi:hypothetical protein
LKTLSFRLLYYSPAEKVIRPSHTALFPLPSDYQVAVPNEQGNLIQPGLYFMKRPHMREFIHGFPALTEGFL